MSVADREFAELATCTGLDRARWERIIAAPPDIQKLEIQNYKDQDWTDPSTGTGQKVLALLEVIGTVAGVVAGVAGAISAIRALRS